MKYLRFLQLLSLVGLFFFAGVQASLADAEPLRAVSYNVRYASNQQPNAWPDRRPLLIENIKNMRPDVMGTQEGVYRQLREMDADLPEMTWIGLGREGGSKGEFMAVFYRPDRLTPLEYDHFWLSDTPDVIGSASWGNKYRRMVTWVRFLDKSSPREFYFVNTHFDHQVQEARVLSAELLRERIGGFKHALPVIVVGDFNAVAGASRVHQTLIGDGFLRDSWDSAQRRGDEKVNSFNGFKAPGRASRRIDWILYRGPIRAIETEIITFERDGQYPSDHFPILTTFEWE